MSVLVFPLGHYLAVGENMYIYIYKMKIDFIYNRIYNDWYLFRMDLNL